MRRDEHGGMVNAWGGGRTCGIHCSIAEVTRSLIISLELMGPVPVSGFLREHSTLQRKEMTFSSLASSSGARLWKARGSARIGISPSRCASTSSCIIEVLFKMKTFSIAIVGTSARMMRRKALAIAQSMPMRSNTMCSSSSSNTFTLKSRLNRYNEKELSRSCAA